MPTVFETLIDGFYKAFFESDPEKRRDAIEAWIKGATPILQSAVENELRSCFEPLLEQTSTAEGWQRFATIYSGTYRDYGQHPPRDFPVIDRSQLCLEVHLIDQLRSKQKNENFKVIGPVSPEAHAEVLRIAQQTLSQIISTQAIKLAKERVDTEAAAKSLLQSHPIGNTDEDDDYDDADSGRSPNDDRSDSMNPNYDAYWSSRGR